MTRHAKFYLKRVLLAVTAILLFILVSVLVWGAEEAPTTLTDPHATQHSARPAPQANPIPQPSHSLTVPRKMPITPPVGVKVLQTPQRSLTKKDSYQRKGGVE